MLESILSHFPLQDPVLIFAVVLFIILLAPLLLSRIKVPGIIGLILAGLALGPNGFNILLRGEGIVLFGTVGLLYIMFLAGLEIDMVDFKKNKYKSLLFGVLTFIIPMVVGTAAGHYLLGFPLTSSILLASMFASHTLLAYPIAGRLGVTKNIAVNVTVGGTIITDTAALLVLAVIIGGTKGEITYSFWVQLGISLSIFSFVVLAIFPRITRWFFKNIESEGVSQYIFVLGVVFLSAFLAEVAGVEPIIGAFLAGLALNRLIPHSSSLMNRIEFVGNALFIPFFLISVGMLVDLKVLFGGLEALTVAAVMTIVAIGAKLAAAYFTQKAFKFSDIQRNLIFGLSSAQAAATLAAVLVGYEVGLLDKNVLNGAILMILATSVVSSLVTEKAARKQAIIDSEAPKEIEEIPERLLLPLLDNDSTDPLLEFSFMAKKPKSAEPIYSVCVIKDDEQASTNVLLAGKTIEHIKKFASAAEQEVLPLTRVDMSSNNAILRAIKDLSITGVILEWNAAFTGKGLIGGTVIDFLLDKVGQMMLIPRLVSPINTSKRLLVFVPPEAELERGFARWLIALGHFAKGAGLPVVFFSTTSTRKAITKGLTDAKASINATFSEIENFNNLTSLLQKTTPEDMLAIVSARQATISYSSSMEAIPKLLSRTCTDRNFMLIFPEQPLGLPQEEVFVNYDGEDFSGSSYTSQYPRFIDYGDEETDASEPQAEEEKEEVVFDDADEVFATAETPGAPQQPKNKLGEEGLPGTIEAILHWSKVIARYVKMATVSIFDIRKSFRKDIAEQSIRQQVEFDGTRAWMVVFATLLASMGLNLNLAAAIIGAMFIAPLTGPLLGIGLAMGINDFDLLKKALKNLLLVVAVGVLASTLYFFISPLEQAQSEILARTQPTIYDVLIAVVGGVAAVFAGVKKHRLLLISGINVAIALLPPLCTAGYGLATLQFQFIIGAFYLFFVDAVFVCIAAYLTVRVFGFETIQFVDFWQARRVRMILGAFAFVIILPTIYIAYGVVQKSIFQQRAAQFIEENFGTLSNTRVVSQNISYSLDSSTIELTLFGEPLPQENIEEIRRKMRSYSLQDTYLSVFQPSDPSREIAQMNQSIKAGIIEDLYRRNEEIISDRNEKIKILEEELLFYKKAESFNDKLAGEIRVLFPDITSFSLSRNIFFEIEEQRKDTIATAVVKWEVPRPKQRNDMLKEWLKTRVEEDSIAVIPLYEEPSKKK